jgi:PAS domain S-box-containing protein
VILKPDVGMHGNLTTTVAQEADHAAQLLSQLLACGFPDAIFFKDARRRYISLNEMECQILGVAAPADVIGKTADRLMVAKRARLWRREEAEVLVTGVPLIDRVEAVERDDGSVRWLSTTKAPIRNREGLVTGLVGITRDITHHKLQEDLKEQFVAKISHELRTPTTSIMGAVALVVSEAAGPIPERARKLLDIARTNGERLVSLINDILDLEKVESGMMAFHLTLVDVRSLIEEEIARIQSFAQLYRVTVRLDPGAATGMVSADPGRLAQVISNLLSNAIKFSPAEGEVLVAIERHAGCIRISVRDHGPGIPEAFRHRIFSKFVQVDKKDARAKGGTGLGLSIVKEIVQHMKGDTGFEPAPGCGSVFYVTLPLEDTYALAPQAGIACERS